MLYLWQKGSLLEQMYLIDKKLVSVLAISVPTTEASKENTVLARVPCINYPLLFQKDTSKI